MKKSIVFLVLVILIFGYLSCTTPGFIDNYLDSGVYGYYFETSAAGEVPGILLLMGGSGYDPVYDEIAETLAKNGYDVLLLDYYGGGSDWGGSGIDSEEDIAGYNRNVEAGFEYLQSHDGVDEARLGIIGFSYGGMLGFNSAYAHQNIKALVEMYGYMEMGPENNLSENDFVPLLPPSCVVHGDGDKTVSIDRAESIISLLNKYGIDNEFHVLQGAPHAFIYDAENTVYKDESMKFAVDFFNRYLK